jgi:hypothetical protein
VQITGTAPRLCAAFATAGWYRADEITLATALHIALSSVLGRGYVSAPVSNLYLFGRQQDYAYERPSKNVRARDHVRFWDTGQRSSDKRPIWIGAATKDIQVGLSKATHLPTHKIAWDTDTERMILVSDLAATGWVVQEGWAPSTGTPIRAFNAQGDRYSADGEMATLVLADIWAPPLLLRVCRQLGRQILQSVARALLRWRLPRRGGERAVR